MVVKILECFPIYLEKAHPVLLGEVFCQSLVDLPTKRQVESVAY